MEGYFETDDQVKINYQVCGKGSKTLLFLHGWGGNQISFTTAIASLKGEYTVVTYDHRGFGKSDSPNSGYSVERLTLDLKQLLVHLSLKDVLLIGWSMGGVVATTYLDTYGADLVSGMVLVDVNARILNDENYQYGFYDGNYTKAEAFRDACLIAKDIRLFVQEMPEKANMTLFDPEARAFFVDKVVDQNPLLLPPLAMWLAICQADLTEAFRQLTVPVLFCHGGTSTYCPPKACDHVMSALKRGILAEFPECSHFIPIERPEKFADEIDQFVRQCIQ